MYIQRQQRGSVEQNAAPLGCGCLPLVLIAGIGILGFNFFNGGDLPGVFQGALAWAQAHWPFK